MPRSAYRLVWFQHFHKAAGTSLVRLALANGELPIEGHSNGNLVEPGTRRSIPVWTWDADALHGLIDRFERLGVTFIATEFGVPDLLALSRDPRVRLVTCLREPLARFVSNYYFDLHRGYGKSVRLADYEGSRGNFTLANYYCWMLSRQSSDAHAVTSADFEAAMANLSLFDLAFAAEQPSGWQTLRDTLGWTGEIPAANRNRFQWRQIADLGRRGRFAPILRQLSQPIREPHPAFVAQFHQAHRFDIELYARLQAQDVAARDSG